jgi:hypothetical protein
MPAKVRAIPAHILAFIHLQALAWGGIGAGSFTTEPDSWDKDGDPLCVHGLCRANSNPLVDELDGGLEARNALIDAGIYFAENDRAVRRVQKRLGLPKDARIPFEEWAAELNVVPMENLKGYVPPENLEGVL